MTDTEVAAAPAPVEKEVVAKTDSPKKTKETKAKKPVTKPTHPSAGDMVTAAVTALAEKNGSSLQAIKKYIAANYKVEIEKQSMFIKKFLKAAVEKGTLVQTKGKGASGSFKLPVSKLAAKPKAAAGEKKAAPKKPAARKPAAKKASEAKVSVKEASKPKKAAAAKKSASPKKAKAPAKPKAAAEPKAKKAAAPKAKKAAKAPTAKPKAPKPKKAAAPKAAKNPAKKTTAKN
ncbi:histone H1-like [Cotesia typhae]|uniref:histone H1-like n=1 Tax=Cotesia typhae TaxID=2053667 RepID=UPI003D69E95D